MNEYKLVSTGDIMKKKGGMPKDIEEDNNFIAEQANMLGRHGRRLVGIAAVSGRYHTLYFERPIKS